MINTTIEPIPLIPAPHDFRTRNERGTLRTNLKLPEKHGVKHQKNQFHHGCCAGELAEKPKRALISKGPFRQLNLSPFSEVFISYA